MKRLIFILFFLLLSCINSYASDNISNYTNYPYKSIQLTQADNDEILLLLKASADIMSYDCKNYDIHELTKSVLYTKNNFKVLGLVPLYENSSNTSLKFCNSEFIESVLYKVFRLHPEKPSADKLLDYSYYYSNGYYYYSGGFNTYFATDVIDISEIYQITDNTFYVVFRNTYVEYNKPDQYEFSFAVVSCDNNGYYLKRLDMNSEPLSYNQLKEYAHNDIFNLLPGLKKYFPAAIILTGIILIVIVIYKYIL